MPEPQHQVLDFLQRLVALKALRDARDRATAAYEQARDEILEEIGALSGKRPQPAAPRLAVVARQQKTPAS